MKFLGAAAPTACTGSGVGHCCTGVELLAAGALSDARGLPNCCAPACAAEPPCCSRRAAALLLVVEAAASQWWRSSTLPSPPIVHHKFTWCIWTGIVIQHAQSRPDLWVCDLAAACMMMSLCTLCVGVIHACKYIMQTCGHCTGSCCSRPAGTHEQSMKLPQGHARQRRGCRTNERQCSYPEQQFGSYVSCWHVPDADDEQCQGQRQRAAAEV